VQHDTGVPRYQATLEACTLRLRAIVMTSFAFILGVLPLLVARGAGAEMRRTLGMAVFAGMLGVTLFGIFLTPVFYFVIQWLNDRWSRRETVVKGFQDRMDRFKRTVRHLLRLQKVDTGNGNGA
jgi:multidrug efflux pump